MKIHSSQRKSVRTTMYSMVFDSSFVKSCVFFLFTFLLLQPVAPVLANIDEELTDTAPLEVTVDEEFVVPQSLEEEVVLRTPDDVISGVISEDSDNEESELESNKQVGEESKLITEIPDNSNEKISVDVVDQDEVFGENETATTSDKVAVIDENVIDEVNETSSTTVEASLPEAIATSTTSDVIDTETDVVIENEVVDEISDVEEVLAEEPQVDDVVQDADPVPTSTEPVNPIVPSVQFSDLNKYQFGAQECVGVGDGAYYCSKTTDENLKARENGIYSARDDEGDSEIYITLNGDTVQLSDNLVEDGAPYYDPQSETVVWHRLENGRHEIIQYDLQNRSEKYITNNNINDTEPTVSGEYTVWQRWIHDNWEIMLFNGTDEKQLTQNETHDVAPHIKGGYVIWHATGQDGETHIGVYEIESGLTSTIEDTDSGSVENPRFVLVYDTTYENGDVVTKGYDFESKAVVPLSAVPYELPSELPEPDSTGETRALIQNKSPNSKDVALEDDVSNDPSETGTSTPSSGNLIASSTSLLPSEEITTLPTTLDLTATSSVPMELTDFDLVVTPYAASSSAQEVHSASSTNFVE